MEELQARHRKEQHDLQSRTTQKKKQASKKTRKGVNDECTLLQQELSARHQAELADLDPRDPVYEESHAHSDTLKDSDLLNALVADANKPVGLQKTLQDPSISAPHTDSSQTEVTSSPPRKPNRQKARLARRAAEQEEAALQAAEEASSLPNLKEQERVKIVAAMKSRGLKEKEVAANGHCMYLSMADQLSQLKIPLNSATHINGLSNHNAISNAPQEVDFKVVRHATAAYISEHPDDFTPFLEEPLNEYLHKIKNTGEWGGQLELLALAKNYKVNINVVQGDGRIEKIEGGDNVGAEAWLAYYRHGFGLGEHYNSLRKTY